MESTILKTLSTSAIAVAVIAVPATAGDMMLEFGTNTAFEMAEQDVFVDDGNGSVKRIRPADTDNMMDAKLFGATVSPPFQPMNFEPSETYGKGLELGITLEEWLSASAKGTFACDGGKSVFNVEFTGLRPNAVYTMWNFIDADPPTDPWQGILYPLGARDGSDAAFTSDADGNAVYSVTFEPCIEASGTQTMAGVAAAWHPDGKTHGSSPGKLGVDSFAHVMAGFTQ